MKQLYELIEEVRDIIAEKLLPQFSLEKVYETVMYTFIYTALQRKLRDHELLKPLENRIPQPLLIAGRRELVGKLYDVTNHIDSILSTNKALLIREEADLRYVVDSLKREIGGVDHVLLYDCMSLIEELVISAFLKTKGVRSLFLNTIFLNPLGLTRFMTQQLSDTKYQPSLFNIARYIAKQLNALTYEKNSFVDRKVHDVGLLGISEFLDKMAIEKIANEVLSAASRGRVLIISDHGYDVIASLDESYIYVVHGFKQVSGFGVIPLLLLSRVTIPMEAYGVGVP